MEEDASQNEGNARLQRALPLLLGARVLLQVPFQLNLPKARGVESVSLSASFLLYQHYMVNNATHKLK